MNFIGMACELIQLIINYKFGFLAICLNSPL